MSTTTSVAPPETEESSVAAEPAPVTFRVRLRRGGPRFLIGTGVVMVLFAAFQIWGTAIQESRAQSTLREEFGRLAVTGAEPVTLETSPVGASGARPSADAAASGIDVGSSSGSAPGERLVRGAADTGNLQFIPLGGEALAHLEIPVIDVDKIAVNSVEVGALRRGPGHYSVTALPGRKGNSAFAGHRTTYGAPFGDIDELVPGDEIVVTTSEGQFTYLVMDPTVAYADRLEDVAAVERGHMIVDPAATWVLGYFGDDRLTLTACHPKFSARQRIIVAAALVGAPVGSAPVPIGEATVGADGPVDLGAAEDEAAAERQSSDSSAGAAEVDSGQPELIDGAAALASSNPDLDRGLNGERGALLPAILWLLAGIAVWFGAGTYGRKWFGQRVPRLALRLVSAVPVGVCLWYCFEAADRALPAY